MVEARDIGNRGIEDLVSAVDELNDIALNSQKANKGTENERDEGEEYLRNYAHGHGKEIAGDNYSATPENIHGELVKAIIDGRQGVLGSIRIGLLTERIDYILGDDQIGKGALESLAMSKPVRESAEEKESKVLKAYEGVQSGKVLINQLAEKGIESLPEEIRENVTHMAADGAGKVNREHFKQQGYDEQVQQSGEIAARIAVLRGSYDKSKIQEYAVEGLSGNIERARERYDKISTDVGLDVYGAVRNVIKRLASDVKTRDTAESLIYGSYKQSEENGNSEDSEQIVISE